jgi:hypothetical protein
MGSGRVLWVRRGCGPLSGPALRRRRPLGRMDDDVSVVGLRLDLGRQRPLLDHADDLLGRVSGCILRWGWWECVGVCFRPSIFLHFVPFYTILPSHDLWGG